MNLKFHPIQIDSADPFANDRLNRKAEVENLTSLICNVNSPAVLAINSAWGTGKTTFIKMWENHLKNQGIKSLYFNAWETDFSDDPLLAFLGEMDDTIDNLIGKSEAKKKFWDKTKKAGKQIAKRGIPALIKIGTAGVIDADKIIEDELSKVMEGLAGDALDNYLKQKKSIASFRDSLEELFKESRQGKPVVIFVDELDRCRPTYAISLLERIKHLFNIEGLVFVLSLDKEQLGHSIGAVYGAGIDSISYLRRFIDFEYQLRQPEIKEYVKFLFTAFALDKYFAPRKHYMELQHDGDNLENVFLMLSEYHRLSLREIEQLLASINLALRTAKENKYIYPGLLAFLVVVKNKNAELYRRYLSPSTTDTEMVNYLHELIPEINRNYQCAVIEALLIIAKTKQRRVDKSEAIARYDAILNSKDASQYYDDVRNILNDRHRSLDVDLNKLVQRIEMLSQLQFDEVKVN